MKIRKYQVNFCVAVPVSDCIESEQIAQELEYQVGGIKLGIDDASAIFDVRVGKTYRSLPKEVKKSLAENLDLTNIDIDE